MRLREYLTETEPTKMPSKQLKYFKELVAEFKAGNPGYKYTSINGFMKDLEKDDYKSLSVLFNGLGVKSIDEFVRKYKDYVDQVNETVAFGSPQDQARKAKLDKVIRVKGSTSQYAHRELMVELIGKKWPSDIDLIWYCDYPWGAPFGGRVEKGDKTAIVKVHTD